VKSLVRKIQVDPVDETWFDEVQNTLYKILLKVYAYKNIKFYKIIYILHLNLKTYFK